MRIVNLMEDTKGERGLLYEHGLSFYIETASHKVLADTGSGSAFIENAEKLGVDLTKVDTVIISHGHYDHAGGVLAFAKLNSNAKIYIHRNAVGDFYSMKTETPKYIGIDPRIAPLPQIVFVDDDTVIDNELSLFTGVTGKKLLPRGNALLKEKHGEFFIQDEFDHEMYLVVTQQSMKVLISGCAHKGIINILDRYSEIYGGVPTHVISGFHTVNTEYRKEDIELIKETAKLLVKTNTRFYSGHCTGDRPLELFKAIMGDKLAVIHSGDRII